jgi:hypothetical protein
MPFDVLPEIYCLHVCWRRLQTQQHVFLALLALLLLLLLLPLLLLLLQVC